MELGELKNKWKELDKHVKAQDEKIRELTDQIIANKVKSVPREFINEQGNNVTDECLSYIMPLIEGETHPEFAHGLPVHIIL